MCTVAHIYLGDFDYMFMYSVHASNVFNYKKYICITSWFTIRIKCIRKEINNTLLLQSSTVLHYLLFTV